MNELVPCCYVYFLKRLFPVGDEYPGDDRKVVILLGLGDVRLRDKHLSID